MELRSLPHGCPMPSRRPVATENGMVRDGGLQVVTNATTQIEVSVCFPSAPSTWIWER